MIKSIEWIADKLKIIDQTEIPHRLEYRELQTVEEVFEAIRSLRIRGAPAIGVAAAFGLFLGLEKRNFSHRDDFLNQAHQLAEYLASARPTAVNLKWALQSVISKIESLEEKPSSLLEKVLTLAIEIQKDDERRCENIGRHGADLLAEGMTVLTHCNTGALATAGIGTAFAAIHTAHSQGKSIRVLVDETRPLLQGARLTMWECQQAGIPATLISDNMAAYAMQLGKVDMVIVGADRIAANGDVANKIGTYSLAVNCRYHHIPFYVAAPLSTFDFSLPSGEEIPIEERNSREVATIWGKLEITTKDATCWNPAFDVTPAHFIEGVITEEGIASPPYEESLTIFKRKIQQNNKELIL